MFRIESGGLVDRKQPLSFSFDGQVLTGFKGDTLASALLANNITTIARSLKFHRPRGIVAAGAEEPNALVNLTYNGCQEPNARATTVELCDGLTVSSQNCWPNAKHDLTGSIDWVNRFLPAGFYYKTFLWPNWNFYEKLIKHSAGLGRLKNQAGSSTYVHRNAHVDVLIVGGGLAGLVAAQALAKSGISILLAEQSHQLGGRLLWQSNHINGQTGQGFVQSLISELEAYPNITMVKNTCVNSYHDHNFIVMDQYVSRFSNTVTSASKQPTQRLWKVRARTVILATGAIERPLIFPDNDRPGIMLASASVEYLGRYGVATGKNICVYTNNNQGVRDAIALKKRGAKINNIITIQKTLPGALTALVKDARIEIFSDAYVVGTKGRKRLASLKVLPSTGTKPFNLPCDNLLMAGGYSPTVHLFSQSGGKLIFDDEDHCFVPGASTQNCISIGAANGVFSQRLTIQGAQEAARTTLTQQGTECSDFPEYTVEEEGRRSGDLTPIWHLPPEIISRYQGKLSRQWVDFQNDVTQDDISLAVREGMQSVEHLKRYTSIGMAPDQGKTSNVNALTILGHETDRETPEVGTTKFRPPYTPLGFGVIAGSYRGELSLPRRYLPAHITHLKSDAHFLESGGWLRPEYYAKNTETKDKTISREMLAVRNSVGLFDASPLGKIIVTGADASDFLDHVFVNRVSNLKPGRARYGIIATEHGIIYDDGIIIRTNDYSFILTTSSAKTDAVYQMLHEWLQCEWLHYDVSVQNQSSHWTTVVIAGSQSRKVLGNLDANLNISSTSFPHMAFRQGEIAGVDALILRSSFTGELQYEISVPARYANAFWEATMAAGKRYNIAPIGIEAWTRLRLEKGHIIVDVDTDGTTIPDDLGMTLWRKKKAFFIGKRSLLRPEAVRQDRWQLVGLENSISDELIPVGTHILSNPGAKPPCDTYGRVTSSCISLTLSKSIALGLIENGSNRTGEIITGFFDQKKYRLKIVALPFLDPEGVRLNV